MSYSETIHKIRAARADRDAVKDRLYGLQMQYQLLKKQHPGDAAGNAEIKRIKTAIDRTLRTSKAASQSLLQTIGGLFAQQSPQQLIEQWDDGIPIVLLPVRLETKFKQDNGLNELWVRIFPDDIAVVTHEKVLTETEVTYGTAHWKALWKASGDKAKKQAAWQMLTDKFGVNRAAWVALQTKPLHWEQAAGLQDEADLRFPEMPLTKPNSWTEAPHTRVMPDHFVVLGYRRGEIVYSAVGAQVDDTLIVGPAPVEDGDDPALTKDPADNRIKYGADFKWIADFDEALQKGMGFKIRFDQQEASAGFDQLLVVGLKLSADQEDGQQLLEELLENHRYSINGLHLIQQGTPTNNTEEEDAGFSKKQTVADISTFIEQDQVLFSPTADWREATDGQRLADYLGLNYGLFQSVPNSGQRDHTEAIAMNMALYAGTLGYYMHSMLGDVIGDEGLSHLRDHFTHMVTGRGPLAPIRVGDQPYGFVLTSAFDQWKYQRRRRPEVFTTVTPYDAFYEKMYAFLKFLQEEWQHKTATLAHISKQGDAGKNLMEVLGLHPHSVEFYQRVGYSLDYLENVEAFGWDGKYAEDRIKLFLENLQVRGLLRRFGYQETKADHTPKDVPLIMQLIFQHYHTRLDANNLIDDQPLSEVRFIKPYDEASGQHYLDWLIAHAGDPSGLEQEDFGGADKPNALLYMMLRYAQLHETSQSIVQYLSKNKIDGRELLRSRKFMNISSAPTVSHWEVFQAPVNEIVPAENATVPLYQFMHAQLAVEGQADLVKNLAEHKWALPILKDMPTARLERALVEHMDTLSYRLDAWQTALFEQRLRSQRGLATDNANRRQGIYLGAYGYLENVKPGHKRSKISEDQLPESLREHKDNLYTESGNGGYVHAPSLNHATAAAILRNGYLTHGNPSERELFSINLSSERVRRAKYVLEGITNGQTLEALLGYQFERGLHDWTTRSPDPVILEHLIPDFRLAFPITKTKVPQEGKTTGPEAVTQDYHVVNGLTLAHTTAAFPYGISTFPTLDADQISAIETEKKAIENTLDAIQDVLVAESAYQLALGNFDRAAAVMQCISDSTVPPDTEVIYSSRGTDLSLTNKVVLHFDSTLTANPWPAIPFTQKALMEPALNHWIGTILGDPSQIRCQVMAVDQQGNILKKPDDSEIKDTMTLADLSLQPLDVLYLIHSSDNRSEQSELEERIRYAFARTHGLAESVTVKMVFAESGDPSNLAVKSFAEVLPLIHYLRELVSGSRPLDAKDFLSASKTYTVDPNNTENQDGSELLNRVQNLSGHYDNLLMALTTAVDDLTDLNTAAAAEALRTQLKAIADAGFAFAFPQSASGADDAIVASLITQGTSVKERLEKAKAFFDQSLLTVNDPQTKIPQQVSLLREMVQSFLGADFMVLPKFSFNNVAELTQADGSREQLLHYATDSAKIPLPVTEWLHGVSVVRSPMHTLEMIRLLNDSFNDSPLALSPIQLPYREADSWLAIAFPEGTTIQHDTHSIIQCNPQGFAAAKPQCGLMIDSWTETIPNKEEVTGMAFNYNQPNSVPPQAILLAVTPDQSGQWQWDQLLDSILDTFARAKRRAIEPDHVDQMSGISTLLPALLTAFSTSKSSISLDYSLNITAVVNAVADLFKNNQTG